MKKTFGQILRSLRKESKESQQELADFLKVSRSAVGNYELDTRMPDQEAMEAIADHYNVDMDYLYGRSDIPNKYKYQLNNLAHAAAVRIPVYGSIPAGIPLEAIQELDPEDWEEIPANWIHGDEKYIALRVHGTSMEPQIPDESVAILKTGEPFRNGRIFAVYVDSDYDATLKKVYTHADGSITLEPFNPDFPTMHYSREDVRRLPVVPLGKLVEVRTSW